MARDVKQWAATALACVLALAASASAGQPARVRLIAVGEVPERAAGLDVRIGGLSGLAFDAKAGTWIAVSDVKSGPSFVELRLTLGPALTLEVPVRQTLHVEVARVFGHAALQRGSPTDAEAIALTPDGGEWFVGFEQPPSLLRLNPVTGVGVPAPIPNSLIERIRPNRGFESVTLRHAADGLELWAATENAVLPDPVATRSEGQRCRVLVFDPVSLAQRRELVYITESLRAQETSPRAFAALADLAAIPDGRVLALEKNWSTEHGAGAQIFSLSGESEAIATDPREPRALIKQPVADLRELGAAPGGTMEAMAVGPALAAGSKEMLLVLVEDNNFAAGRGSQVIVLGLTP